MESVPTCDLYLRLSDARIEEAFEGREAKLRALAARLGWIVHRVVVENDVICRVDRVTFKDGRCPRCGSMDGKPKPASAWKKHRIRTPSGGVKLRVIRPRFREVVDDIASGRVNGMLTEDLDRVVRDPRDLEDLLDACEMTGASARSISGSLTITDGGNETEKFTARIMVAQAAKASADTSRRVAANKDQMHGQSYFGGLRPYGYAHVQDTEKYHRTLMIIPDEAEVLRNAAADILDRDISEHAIVRGLNAQDSRTVTGKEWTTQKLRQVLLKPAIAGKAAHTVKVLGSDDKPVVIDGKVQTRVILKDAPWEPILKPEVWERLVSKLTDPSRVKTTGNEPRWLLSKIGECSVCNDGSTVWVSGTKKDTGPAYVCERNHLRRNVGHTDNHVEGIVVALLERDGQDILKPPVRQGIDTGRLKAEQRDLRKRKASQMHLHSIGAIDDDDLAAGMKEIRDRLTVVEAQLRASDEPDPLAEFRDQPARAVWDSLPLPRKRAVIRLLVRVKFQRTARRGPGFDPGSVVVEPRYSIAPQAVA